MTYRERREARVARLQEWAAKREQKAAQAYQTAKQLGDAIPFGQPILVDHYSANRHRRDIDRIHNAMGKSVEHSRMAESMSSRAENIAAQLDVSIYDDDPDACERLREKIATLEAERDLIKRFNASCRKGHRDPSILSDAQRADIESCERYAHYQLSKGGGFPSYKLNYLGKRINEAKKRLARLTPKEG